MTLKITLDTLLILGEKIKGLLENKSKSIELKILNIESRCKSIELKASEIESKCRDTALKTLEIEKKLKLVESEYLSKFKNIHKEFNENFLNHQKSNESLELKIRKNKVRNNFTMIIAIVSILITISLFIYDKI